MTHLLCLHKFKNFKSFISQVSTSSRKGLCFLAQDMADRTTQMQVAKAHVAEFSNKHAQQEVNEENTNPQVFVPASDARHRPFKRKSGVEGKLLIRKLRKEVTMYIKLYM